MKKFILIFCFIIGITLTLLSTNGWKEKNSLEKIQEMCPEIDEICEEDFIELCELSCYETCGSSPWGVCMLGEWVKT